MHASLSRDIKCYSDKSGRELLEILARALDELKEFDAIMIENSRANVAIAKDYISLVDKCKTMEEEIQTLKTALVKSIHDNRLKTTDIFGRSTEKLSDIVDSPMTMEIVDEDTVEVSLAGVVPIDRASGKSQHNESRTRGKKLPENAKRILQIFHLLMSMRLMSMNSIDCMGRTTGV